MIAALGTIPFIATLWLLVVLGAAVLEESGSKLVAALKGKSTREPLAGRVTVRVRVRSQPQQVRRDEPRLRAAA